jgi:hypothetical protein
MGGTGGAGAGSGSGGTSGVIPPSGPKCGAGERGTTLVIADDIEVCLPPVVCTSETCPPGLGRCVNGSCEYLGDYQGLKTFPQAWATQYCKLSSGGCHGVTQNEYPEATAGALAQALSLPLCESAAPGAKCVGIAASSPMVVGNSEVAVDPTTGRIVNAWGLGLTEASGLCYELTGPGGTVVVALTDRCGGYCKCKGSGYQECGACVSEADMAPNCPCVGSAPALHGECCGRGCSVTKSDCDWCASNNHPHFDLDDGTFERACGADAKLGSCRLTKARFFPCRAPAAKWPPPGSGGSCGANSFRCLEPTANQPLVPGTSCCCNWNLKPKPDGSCG